MAVPAFLMTMAAGRVVASPIARHRLTPILIYARACVRVSTLCVTGMAISRQGPGDSQWRKIGQKVHIYT